MTTPLIQSDIIQAWSWSNISTPLKQVGHRRCALLREVTISVLQRHLIWRIIWFVNENVVRYWWSTSFSLFCLVFFPLRSASAHEPQIHRSDHFSREKTRRLFVVSFRQQADFAILISISISDWVQSCYKCLPFRSHIFHGSRFPRASRGSTHLLVCSLRYTPD